MRPEELLRTGRIRRETVSPAEIREAPKLAARDLRVDARRGRLRTGERLRAEFASAGHRGKPSGGLRAEPTRDTPAVLGTWLDESG
jgi:hypothetical protein